MNKGTLCRFIFPGRVILIPGWVILILVASGVLLGSWPILGRRSGKVHSLSELSRMERLLGDKLKAMPTSGDLSWKEYSERPPRVRVEGRANIDKFYRWSFNAERPEGDTGMASIVRPHPESEIGDIGDRFYEFDGVSGDYKYNGIILLDGRFQIDLYKKIISQE